MSLRFGNPLRQRHHGVIVLVAAAFVGAGVTLGAFLVFQRTVNTGPVSDVAIDGQGNTWMTSQCAVAKYDPVGVLSFSIPYDFGRCYREVEAGPDFVWLLSHEDEDLEESARARIEKLNLDGTPVLDANGFEITLDDVEHLEMYDEDAGFYVDTIAVGGPDHRLFVAGNHPLLKEFDDFTHVADYDISGADPGRIAVSPTGDLAMERDDSTLAVVSAADLALGRGANLLYTFAIWGPDAEPECDIETLAGCDVTYPGASSPGDGRFSLWGAGRFDWDTNGDLLVADPGNHRVQKFDGGSGRFVDKFGSKGSGPNQFRWPSVIDVNGASIAVGGQDRVDRDGDGHLGDVRIFVEAVVDTTPPQISCAEADGLWHAANVSLACTAVDTGAGLANAADASFSLSTSTPAGQEGTNEFTASRLICDNASPANCATAGPVGGNRIDRRAPVPTITSPSVNAAFALGQAVPASYGCFDGGSGLASCAGPAPSGQNIDTASVGLKTFSVTGVDQVGNSITLTVSYAVLGPQPTIAGLIQQVENLPLRPATRRALVATLRAAEQAVAQRRVTLARLLVQTFIAEVRLLMRLGQLSPAAGQQLISSAQAIAAGWSGP